MIPVIIPAKPLDQALRRLSGVLDAAERRALQAAMLSDVLTAAAAFTGRIVVVTSDDIAADLARQHGAVVAPDTVPPMGINAAVGRGLNALDTQAALVVMGDLPFATADDLRQIAIAGAGTRGITVAISHDGTGTNALLLAPPTIIQPAFGVDSLAHHLAAAEAAGCEATVVTAPGLMLDVDTPEDLALLARQPGTSASGRLCTALRIDERIPAIAPR